MSAQTHHERPPITNDQAGRIRAGIMPGAFLVQVEAGYLASLYTRLDSARRIAVTYEQQLARIEEIVASDIPAGCAVRAVTLVLDPPDRGDVGTPARDAAAAQHEGRATLDEVLDPTPSGLVPRVVARINTDDGSGGAA